MDLRNVCPQQTNNPTETVQRFQPIQRSIHRLADFTLCQRVPGILGLNTTTNMFDTRVDTYYCFCTYIIYNILLIKITSRAMLIF